MLHVLGPAGQDVVGDHAAQRVRHDGDLAALGLEVGIPLHEHLVQAVQFLLQRLPDLHPGRKLRTAKLIVAKTSKFLLLNRSVLRHASKKWCFFAKIGWKAFSLSLYQ